MSRRNSKIPHTVLSDIDELEERMAVTQNGALTLPAAEPCQLCGQATCRNKDCLSELKWNHRFRRKVKAKLMALCRPITKKDKERPPANASWWQRILYDIRLPMSGDASRLITLILLAFFVWAGLWSVLLDDMLPGGNIFGLYLIVVFALILGYLVELVKLAPLLGMLIVGVVLRNVYPIDYGRYINKNWSGAIRNLALTVILTRAGLGLDQAAIQKRLWACLSLATVPTICITAFITVVAPYMLDFPWVWSAALGFLISAVSPAVIVPIMLVFQERKLGGSKGLPSLVIASATICDVIAICGNGILLGIALSNGSLAWNIGAIPLTIVVGIGFGVLFGILLWYFPSGDDAGATIFRFILLLCFGTLCIFGSKVINLSGAGALGALITPVVASRKWRQMGYGESIASISIALKYCWYIFQPLLFGLIGAAVDFQTLIPEKVGMAIGLLLAAHVFQFLTTLLATFRFGFNWKENIFLAISFLPKATIQAAIGSAALDYAHKLHKDEATIQLGRDTLNCAVLAIIFMAPIGGVGLMLSGPKLLDPPPTDVESSPPPTPDGDKAPMGLVNVKEGVDNPALEHELEENIELEQVVRRRASSLAQIEGIAKRFEKS